MTRVIRCLSCREEFPEAGTYLDHECEKPADVELAENIARIAVSLEELGNELDEIDAFFGPDDDPPPTLGFRGYLIVGVALIAALGLLVVDGLRLLVRKAIGK